MTSSEPGSAYPAPPGAPGPDVDEPLPEEALPEPVFVDESGLRGRLLRGLGWPVSVVGAVLAVAMGGSLIGVQADAPPMDIPAQPAPAAAAPSASPSAGPSPSASSSASAPASGAPSRSTSPPKAGNSAGTSKPPAGGTPSGRATKHP
ncbi:hypothetical protein [Kitasatospora sp. NPDC048407]|uniref:hypothetical protein n=1 Tax=Kitasatospora sp. NPDC048407 TaxID=3364051 RepID=UPI00371151D3